MVGTTISCTDKDIIAPSRCSSWTPPDSTSRGTTACGHLEDRPPCPGWFVRDFAIGDRGGEILLSRLIVRGAPANSKATSFRCLPLMGTQGWRREYFDASTHGFAANGHACRRPSLPAPPREDGRLAALLSDCLPLRQLPARPDEMTGVAVRIALQVILVFRLGLPEVACGRHFRRRGARP